MKGLSLSQPWASLVVHGYKQIETRSWWTSYHGPLVIHARKNRAFLPFLDDPLTQRFLPPAALNDVPYPCGVLVGMVQLIHVAKTDGGWFTTGQYRISATEEALGDYGPGRYGWVFREPVVFAEPIPCRGHLGLWSLPTTLEALIIGQQVQETHQ